MARLLLLHPSKELETSPLPLPLISAFLLLTIITLIFSFCASHHRKSRPCSPPTTSLSSSQEHEEKVNGLPATHGPIGPADPPSPTKSITPRRKLSISLSLKLPEGLTRLQIGRRETQEKERTAFEDSTWMKTIILGEKCKVPENGEQEDEEIIVYDEKGNRQRNYHPRTPRSMPVSRTNSFFISSSSSS